MYPNGLVSLNLCQWVNIKESSLLSLHWQIEVTGWYQQIGTKHQYCWIYTDRSILTNLPSQVYINQSTMKIQYLWNYLKRSILRNLPWINIDESTPRCHYCWIYTKSILTNLSNQIDINKSNHPSWFWRIYQVGSIWTNLPRWSNIDESTPKGLYQ